MSRDPRHYTNPEDFNPDRFIGDNPELDPRSYIFGFGRRICPGRFLGESTVFLAIVTILATMNIEKPLDPNGKEIAPVLEYTTGVVT
jgi:cytochrome P450